MSRKLTETIEADIARSQRRGRAELQRLVGILDLDPPLCSEAVRAVVEDELADQRRAVTDALRSQPDALARAALDLLAASPPGFPRDTLAALTSPSSSSSSSSSLLARAIDRFDRFERRLGWLLRPSTKEEIDRLDPKRDCNQIYHFISYEFRLEQKLFAALFELAPLMLPYSYIMFGSTGEFELRAFRRINDTVMFFSNMIEWGIDSKRGRDAVARINAIHGRYSLPNELFRFILSGIMFIPPLWNQRLGWRPFTDTERLGWFYTFLEMGRAMNIQGLTDDHDEMKRWYLDMVDKAAESSAAATNGFHEILVQVLATYPAPLRRPLLIAILCGMGDAYREVLDIPPPPEEAVAEVRQALRLIGELSSRLPRVPWIRSLQLHPMYRDVDSFGVHARSSFMPGKAGDGAANASEVASAVPGADDNRGFPAGQPPLTSVTQIPDQSLPEIDRAEVARHATATDGWVIIGGFVYDVSRMLHLHPGGADVLLRRLGTDATSAFEKVGHSHGALMMMANFRVARVKGEPAREVTDPARPGGRIHTGRRAGKDKRYAPADWDATLDYLIGQTALYEAALRDPNRDPKRFPILMPLSPRAEAMRKALARERERE